MVTYNDEQIGGVFTILKESKRIIVLISNAVITGKQ